MSRRLLLIAAACAALIGAGSGDAQSGAPAGTQFTLTGVVFVEGGAGRAWLQEPTLTHNEIVTVRPGDSIGPYRLTKVLEDRVELEGPAGKFSVRLAGTPGAATVAASPPPRLGVAGPASTPEVQEAPVTEQKPPAASRKKFTFESVNFGSLPSLLNPSQ